MNNAIKYVPLSCLNSSGFSNKDLAVHNKLVIKVSEYPSGTKFSQEPWRYLDFPYIGDDIVPIGEIKFGGSDASAGNSIANYQSVRSANNPKLKEIRNSIEQHGYDLKAIPIAVYEYKDKDGETRTRNIYETVKADITIHEIHSNALVTASGIC